MGLMSVYTLYYPKSPMRNRDDPLYGSAEKRIVFRIQGDQCIVMFQSWHESQTQTIWAESSMDVVFPYGDSESSLVWKLQTGSVIPVEGNGVTARNLWDIMRSKGYIR
jgi:hypothetical protein